MANQSSQGKRVVHGAGWHVAVNTPATVIAVMACLVLLAGSLLLVITVSTQSPAVLAEVSGTNVFIKKSPTLTVTTTTPSPTATATPSPTPKATQTATPSPSPTATATAAATATATATPTATAIPTATAQPTATLQPTATQNPNANATPTSVPTSQNTGSGGGTGTPPSTPTTQSGGSSFPILPIIIGLVASLAIVSVCGLGFVVLRQRVLPTDPSRTNLPPSGARPWSRLRQGSMHGNTNLYNEQTMANNAFNANNTPPFGNASSWATQMNGPMQGMNYAQSQAMPVNAPSPDGFIPPQGFPPQGPLSPQSQPYPQVQPNSGFSQSQPYPQVQPNSGFSQSQPYPQVQPNSGFPPTQNYPTQNYPSQNYPPQQGFPPVQPNGGFYPSNMGNADIALMHDSAHTLAIHESNRARRKLSPVRLCWMDSDTGDNHASIANISNIAHAGISSISSSTGGMPTIPATPQLGQERDSEKLPSLDNPILRDTLKHYTQKGKLAPDGEESEET